MSVDDDIAIQVSNLSKCYHIYSEPHHRLKQSFYPRLQRMLGMQPKEYYREFWALKDVSFNVRKGETVGIVGGNGSGKSTLLQMVCGTLNPTGGSIDTNGRVAALLELGSGFNPEFTGRENVYLNAALLGLSKEETEARFEQIAAFADIGEFIEQPVKTYSSGMYVRLAFSVQASVDPEILVVDEALAVGDTYFVHRCMLRFRELQERGTTILFVSHDANAVRNLCSRVIWLKDGSVNAEGDPAKVVHAYLAYLFNRPVVEEKSSSKARVPAEGGGGEGGIPPEPPIPNIDGRLGDQKCEIVGIGLYDESLNPITSTFNERPVILRMTIVNHSLEPGTSMVVGYILRNAKGQEIASANSLIEDCVFEAKPQGEYSTIRMKVDLPRIHAGSYAFSMTAGYIGADGDIALSDRIENAVAVGVLTTKRVHVLMSFPTKFETES